MNLLLKGAALALAVTTAGVAAAPAQAQYVSIQYRDGYRDGWRGNDYRWDQRRRWENRRYRDQRRYYGSRYRNGWRGNYYGGHRQRCWTEWRRDYWGDPVRVRICR